MRRFNPVFHPIQKPVPTGIGFLFLRVESLLLKAVKQETGIAAQPHAGFWIAVPPFADHATA